MLFPLKNEWGKKHILDAAYLVGSICISDNNIFVLYRFSSDANTRQMEYANESGIHKRNIFAEWARV